MVYAAAIGWGILMFVGVGLSVVLLSRSGLPAAPRGLAALLGSGMTFGLVLAALGVREQRVDLASWYLVPELAAGVVGLGLVGWAAAGLRMHIGLSGCTHCGYDLRGLEDDAITRCPECGAAAEPELAVARAGG